MAVTSRGGWWSNDSDKGRDESNIVRREEWEEDEDEDGYASGGVNFVNGRGTREDKDEKHMATMKDDNSNSGGALLLSLPDLSDECASLSTMTIPKLKEKLWVAGLVMHMELTFMDMEDEH